MKPPGLHSGQRLTAVRLCSYHPGNPWGMEMWVFREDLFSGRTLGMGHVSLWGLHASVMDIDSHLHASTCSEV